ncbi:MAG TPA: hypothetical protein P5300_01255 [Acidobacteriota bacterium]|nr:hypothetical protein [Acidobacteriota bacterium]
MMKQADRNVRGGTYGRALRLLVFASIMCVPPAGLPAQDRRILADWEPGMLEIHHINVWGDSTFCIFPDGTTLLVDAPDDADVSRPDRFKAPRRPDDSRPPGEWIGRYIRARHPEGAEGRIDYALMTHFHADHIDGIADVDRQVPIRTLLDRSWPDYPPVAASRVVYSNFRKEFTARGGQIERFVPGRNDQIVCLREPERCEGFQIRNLAAGGEAWSGEGSQTHSPFPENRRADLEENTLSCAFVIRYGSFAYFNGGDLLREMEEFVAPIVGPVDVHVANHHGSEAYYLFLRELRPRIHIVQVWDSIQPRWHALERMRSEDSYRGPRDVFFTNGLWPGREEHLKSSEWAFPEEVLPRYLKAFDEVASAQGHVVVRVAPGGDTYEVFVLDDSDESFRVKSVHGPYDAR